MTARQLRTLVASVLVLGVAAMSGATLACTRVLWNTNGLAVISGRTMDWPESTEPKLVVFPRGLARDGGRFGPDVVVGDNALTWTSKYGSLATTVYGLGTVDGINERGLGAHLLYLTATDYGQRDISKPGLQAALWAQYALDTAATVSEALALLSPVQIVMVEAKGHQASLHLALEDATGDSAIIEYIDGAPVVHHGRDYRIMTNDPPYDQQLALLKSLDFSAPSSETPLPGNVKATDRFQRATYFQSMLPEPKSEAEAVAGILAIMRNVSVPFGAPYKTFGVYNTEYRTVSDLTNLRYFFELTSKPAVIWIALSTFDLSPGAPVLTLDPADDLNGDVSGQFVKLERRVF